MVHNLPSQKAGKNLNDKTSMQVSFRFKDFVFSKSLPRETEEETLWRLIALKQITQEDLKMMPPEYADKLNTGKAHRR